MHDRPRPVPRDVRRRRAVLGHLCPRCRQLWALTAVAGDSGFLVVCRYCAYQRAAVPAQRRAPACETSAD